MGFFRVSHDFPIRQEGNDTMSGNIFDRKAGRLDGWNDWEHWFQMCDCRYNMKHTLILGMENVVS